MTTTLQKALLAAQRDGHNLVAATQFPNPKDNYLALVLCATTSMQYVVWTFNASDMGFHSGCYFDTYAKGFKCYINELNSRFITHAA